MYRDFYPGMGQAVAERTILRKKENSWETWKDVAERVAFGNSLLCKEAAEKSEEYQKMLHHLGKVTLLMSGRHLQHGDETQPERNQEVMTNCSSACTSFVLFYLLMNGSGVGRCYDDDMILVNWDYAPNIRCVLDHKHPDFDYVNHESVRDARHKYGSDKNVIWFQVPDTREGWAKAVEVYETMTYEKVHKDKLLILDFSYIRPKGSPIKGMQNRPSSGPSPLMHAFWKVSSLKGSGVEPWRQAMYIDHYFAECVLVGGARRSARMSTKTWRDKSVLDFIQVKRPLEFIGKNVSEITEIRQESNPLGFLWSSNNSILVDEDFWRLLSVEKDDEEYKSDLAKHARKVFKLLTEASYADGTGEPGVINQHLLVQNDEGMTNYFDGDYVGNDRYQVQDETKLYLGRLAKAAKQKKYYTIVNPCITKDTWIMTSEGPQQVEYLNHPFQAVVNGKNYQSTGFWRTGIKDVYCVKVKSGNSIKATNNHKMLAVRNNSLDREWIEIKDLKIGDSLVLSNNNGHEGIEYILCLTEGGYNVKCDSELNTSETIAKNELKASIAIDYPKIKTIYTSRIISIEHIGKEEVYDCSVEEVHCFDANGLIAHNCGEIAFSMLSSYCVIADTVPYFADDLDEAEEAFRLATRALIRVNTMDSIYKKEVLRTNRIGVGITGVHEFAWKFFGYNFYDLVNEEKSKSFWMTLARFNRAVREEAWEYSKKYGMVFPHTLTTVKPSGCRPRDALTTTDKGLLTLEELFVNHPAGETWADFKGNVSVIQDNEKNKITKTYCNGKSSLLRIKMNNGMTLESTPNHQWFVKSRMENKKKNPVNQWVRAEDLCENDVLDVKVGIYDNKGYPCDNFSWFIGYVTTMIDENNVEGCYHFNVEGWHHFYDACDENREKIKSVLKNLDIEPYEFQTNLTFRSVELQRWLNENVTKYLQKNLMPRFIRELSRDNILSYLAGLIDFNKVLLNENKKDVSIIWLGNRRMVNHLQQVALAVGLSLQLSFVNDSYYLLTLAEGTDESALQVLLKNSNLMQEMEKKHPNLQWKGLADDKTEVHFTVDSIDWADPVETYDIEVEDEHWYYAGAVKSHNTVSKLWGLTEGWHLPAMTFYLRWVQFSDSDPLVEDYIKSGYPYRYLKQYKNTVIIGFPTAPLISTLMPAEKLVTAGQATPEEQYRWLMLGEKYWIEGVTEDGSSLPLRGNQISYTLKYDPKIVDYNGLRQTMLNYQSKIRCCSIMPRENVTSYEYVPEEEISRERYDEITKKIKKDLHEDVDFAHVDCAGGACPVDFNKK